MAIPICDDELEYKSCAMDSESNPLLRQLIKLTMDLYWKGNKSVPQDNRGPKRRSRRGSLKSDVSNRKPKMTAELNIDTTSMSSSSQLVIQDPTEDDLSSTTDTITSLNYSNYRNIGRSLRHIADQFEKNYSPEEYQNEHCRIEDQDECSSGSTFRTMQIKFALQIVMQITIIGLDLAFGR